MTQENRERLGRTFDLSARLYDEARPGYPEELFEDLVRLCGLPDGGKVLEVGCGTGKATLPLARRGYRILCLEPGANLAAIARRNLSAFVPAVEVEERAFEDWKPGSEAFDVVAAAASFWWVDPAVRYIKTAAALRPAGSAAVFWNAHVSLPGHHGFFEAVQEVYRRHAPELIGGPKRPGELPTTLEPGFLETGLFEEMAVRHYPWTETYDTNRYLRLLRTFSDHATLAEASREALLGDVATLIDREFGGRVEKHHVAVLQVARRRGAQEIVRAGPPAKR